MSPSQVSLAVSQIEIADGIVDNTVFRDARNARPQTRHTAPSAVWHPLKAEVHPRVGPSAPTAPGQRPHLDPNA